MPFLPVPFAPGSLRGTGADCKTAPAASDTSAVESAQAWPLVAANDNDVQPLFRTLTRDATAQPCRIDRFVGDALRRERIRAGLTLAQLAHRLGVPIEQVGQFEAGVARLSTDQLDRATTALDVPLSVFFSDTPRRVLGAACAPAQAHVGPAKQVSAATDGTFLPARTVIPLLSPSIWAVRKRVFDVLQALS